jgi:hypothetical protein
MSASFELYPFQSGQILQLKKPHPCGGKTWLVVRTGADIALCCQTCGRHMTLPRRQLEKAVKSVLAEK